MKDKDFKGVFVETYLTVFPGSKEHFSCIGNRIKKLNAMLDRDLQSIKDNAKLSTTLDDFKELDCAVKHNPIQLTFNFED